MKSTSYITLSWLLTLAACSGGVQDTLGLHRQPPDEFRVVSRPPLSVPPQFDLRPPAAPGEVINTQDADKTAQSLILGTTSAAKSNTFTLPGNADTAVAPMEVKPSGKTTATVSPERSFLERAGAADADPMVRQKLEQDRVVHTQPQEEDESWWNIMSVLPPKKDPMVDASGEAERIRKNKDEDKPVTEGATPEIKQKDRGVLGRILGDE